jgi:hypothetical protein
MRSKPSKSYGVQIRVLLEMFGRPRFRVQLGLFLPYCRREARILLGFRLVFRVRHAPNQLAMRP